MSPTAEELRAEVEGLRAEFEPLAERMLEAFRNGGAPEELRANHAERGRALLAALDRLEVDVEEAPDHVNRNAPAPRNSADGLDYGTPE